jgi:hypothetical protein
LICLAVGGGPVRAANPSDQSMAAVQAAVRDIRDRIDAQRWSAEQVSALRAQARKLRIAERMR